MSLGANRRAKNGKDHTGWLPAETGRTPDGSRQWTVCYLGERNTSAEARWVTIQIVVTHGALH